MSKTVHSSDLARQLFRAGRWADAERVARAAVKQERGFAAEAASICGVSALRLGRFAEAVPALRFACESAPRAPSLWLALAEASIPLGDFVEVDRALAAATAAGASPREIAELHGARRRARHELPTSNAWGATDRSEDTTPGQWEDCVAGLLRARMPERARLMLAEAPAGTPAARVRLLSARVAAARLDAAETLELYGVLLREDVGHAEEAFVAMLGVGAFDAAEACAEHEERATGQPICHARLAMFRGEFDVARVCIARIADPAARRPLEAALALAEGRLSDASRWLTTAPRTPAEHVMYLDLLTRLGQGEEAFRHFERLLPSDLASTAASPLVVLACRSMSGRLRSEDHHLFAALVADFPDVATTDDPVRFARAAIDGLSGNWTRSPTRLVAPRTLRVQRIRYPVRERVAALREALRAVPQSEVVTLHDDLQRECGPHPLIDTYRSEFHLWRGDYAAAAAGFRRALDVDARTRWAYIGSATCHLVQGEPEAANKTLAEQERHVSPTRNVLSCMAEVQLRLGQFVEAESTYRDALAAFPTRTSAWVGLGLVGANRGVDALVKEAEAMVKELVPGFFGQWQREAAQLSPGARLEHALAMMRGNRSSNFVTWWTAGGTFHGAGVGEPSHGANT